MSKNPVLAYYRYYKKAVHAAVGLGLLIGLKYLGVEVPGLPTVVLDLIVGALIVGTVERSTNGPKPVKAAK